MVWDGFLWLFGASLYCLTAITVLGILGTIKESIEYKIDSREYLKAKQFLLQQSEVEK